jgi:predicted nucleic acid-binding protein
VSWILDASATLAWAFDRTDQSEAERATRWLDRLARDEAQVPPLWHLEVVNALVIAERRGAIKVAQARNFLGKLTTLPIRTHPEKPDADREHLFSLAREYGLTAYDAAYLALALQMAAPIATFDRRLAAAAVAAGLPLA